MAVTEIKYIFKNIYFYLFLDWFHTLGCSHAMKAHRKLSGQLVNRPPLFHLVLYLFHLSLSNRSPTTHKQ